MYSGADVRDKGFLLIGEGGLADETELLLMSSNQVWEPFTGL